MIPAAEDVFMKCVEARNERESRGAYTGRLLWFVLDGKRGWRGGEKRQMPGARQKFHQAVWRAGLWVCAASISAQMVRGCVVRGELAMAPVRWFPVAVLKGLGRFGVATTALCISFIFKISKRQLQARCRRFCFWR